MYEFRHSTRFRRDLRRCQKQHKPIEKFKAIHELLVQGKSLPEHHREHRLSGHWKGYHECHIEPDWLLIYKLDDHNQRVEYVRMGSHAELFR